MEKIIIKTIPDKSQRYNTVGDYYQTPEGETLISVSDMKNWKYEMLIAIHELVESSLCKDRGINEKEIDDFDLAFETTQARNECAKEPGDSPTAPYFKEHQFATAVEKMLASELNVDWGDYLKQTKKLDLNT